MMISFIQEVLKVCTKNVRSHGNDFFPFNFDHMQTYYY